MHGMHLPSDEPPRVFLTKHRVEDKANRTFKSNPVTVVVATVIVQISLILRPPGDFFNWPPSYRQPIAAVPRQSMEAILHSATCVVLKLTKVSAQCIISEALQQANTSNLWGPLSAPALAPALAVR